MSEDVPFSQAESGTYHVTQPIKGAHPDSMTLTFDGDSYEFSGLAGVVSESRIYPDVLAYDNCMEVDDGN